LLTPLPVSYSIFMTRKDRIIQVKINTKAKNNLIKTFNPGSNLQKYVDMSVARHSDKYAPSDTESLRKSVFVNTVFGLGRLVYSIYGNPNGRNTWNDDTSLFQDRPTRGPRWAQRWFYGGGKETLSREITAFIKRFK